LALGEGPRKEKKPSKGKLSPKRACSQSLHSSLRSGNRLRLAHRNLTGEFSTTKAGIGGSGRRPAQNFRISLLDGITKAASARLSRPKEAKRVQEGAPIGGGGKASISSPSGEGGHRTRFTMKERSEPRNYFTEPGRARKENYQVAFKTKEKMQENFLKSRKGTDGRKQRMT